MPPDVVQQAAAPGPQQAAGAAPAGELGAWLRSLRTPPAGGQGAEAALEIVLDEPSDPRVLATPAVGSYKGLAQRRCGRGLLRCASGHSKLQLQPLVPWPSGVAPCIVAARALMQVVHLSMLHSDAGQPGADTRHSRWTRRA